MSKIVKPKIKSEKVNLKKAEAWEIALPTILFIVKHGNLPPFGLADLIRALGHENCKH